MKKDFSNIFMDARSNFKNSISEGDDSEVILRKRVLQAKKRREKGEIVLKL